MQDSADAIALRALSSACSHGENDQRYAYFVGKTVEIIARTIVVEDDGAANYVNQKYGPLLREHGFEVVAIGSREAEKAIARH